MFLSSVILALDWPTPERVLGILVPLFKAENLIFENASLDRATSDEPY